MCRCSQAAHHRQRGLLTSNDIQWVDVKQARVTLRENDERVVLIEAAG